MNTTTPIIENFGNYLRQNRESRGISLEEISDTTKIHVRYLKALEDNDFDALPGEVFIKGFIRSYAQAIVVDPAEVLKNYDENVGQERLLKNLEAEQQERTRAKPESGFGGLLTVLVLIALGVFIYFNNPWLDNSVAPKPPTASIPETPVIDDEEIAMNPLNADPTDLDQESSLLQAEEDAKLLEPLVKPDDEEEDVDPTPSEPPAEDKKTVEENEKRGIIQQPIPSEPKKEPVQAASADKPKKPAGESESSATSPKKEKKDKKLNLEIRTQDSSWFSVMIDGKQKVDFILPKDSTKNIEGKKSLSLTVGNREGTVVTVNGKIIKLPKGKNNVVRDFLITSKLLE